MTSELKRGRVPSRLMWSVWFLLHHPIQYYYIFTFTNGDANRYQDLYIYYIGYNTIFYGSILFSTATYTSLGYGDIVLGRKWHLLSSIESANDLLLFCWSTPLVLCQFTSSVELLAISEHCLMVKTIKLSV